MSDSLPNDFKGALPNVAIVPDGFQRFRTSWTRGLAISSGIGQISRESLSGRTGNRHWASVDTKVTLQGSRQPPGEFRQEGFALRFPKLGRP